MLSPKITILAGAGLDAHAGRLQHGIPIVCAVFLAQLRRRFQQTKLYGLAREICNCGHRIRIRWKATLDREGLYMGQDLHATSEGTSQVCTCTRARMKDTLELMNARPWSTLLDADLFSGGWQMGAAWTRRNSDRECPVCSVASLTPRIRILGCEHEFGNAPEISSVTDSLSMRLSQRTPPDHFR